MSAEVNVGFNNGLLEIEVLDDGRGAAAVPSDDEGQGIVGMHERISLLEGTIQTGPRPGGGYRVAAKIPIPQP